MFATRLKQDDCQQRQNAKVAQLVERDLAKVEVAGSNPVFRSKKVPLQRDFFMEQGTKKSIRKLIGFFVRIGR